MSVNTMEHVSCMTLSAKVFLSEEGRDQPGSKGGKKLRGAKNKKVDHYRGMMTKLASLESSQEEGRTHTNLERKKGEKFGKFLHALQTPLRLRGVFTEESATAC